MEGLIQLLVTILILLVQQLLAVTRGNGQLAGLLQEMAEVTVAMEAHLILMPVAAVQVVMLEMVVRVERPVLIPVQVVLAVAVAAAGHSHVRITAASPQAVAVVAA